MWALVMPVQNATLAVVQVIAGPVVAVVKDKKDKVDIKNSHWQIVNGCFVVCNCQFTKYQLWLLVCKGNKWYTKAIKYRRDYNDFS